MLKIILLLVLAFSALTSTVVRAEDILEDHKKALGSEEAIAKIKSIRRTAEVKVNGQMSAKGSAVEAVIIREKCCQRMKVARSDVTIAWDGEKGWTVNSSIVLPIPEEQLMYVKAHASINPFVGILTLADPATIKAVDDTEFEGIRCNVYTIGDSTFYLGKEDKLLHGMIRTGPQSASNEPSTATVIYSDFKEYEGVKFPNKTVQKFGNDITTLTYTKTEINPELEDSLFEKP